MHKKTPDEIYAKVRASLGYDHQQMGDLLGVDRTTSIRWEMGTRRPPLIVDALMVAFHKNALTADILQSWMKAASKSIERA